MSWDKGFDFRATSGYVTDPANCTYVLDTDSYPTTRNGVTFGWITAPQSRDRSTLVDARLAGIVFGQNNTFQVDLPDVGNYSITLAVGDANGSQINMSMQVKDNTVNVISLSGITIAFNAEFADATGVLRSSAAWPGSNIPVTVTFSTMTLNMHIDVSDTNTTIAHMFISQMAPTVVGAKLVFRNENYV